MVDISVVTVTKRYGGIDIATDALSSQDFNGSWEWILVDERYEQRKHLVNNLIKDVLPVQFTHTTSKTPSVKRPHGLCNALNSGLLHARGELIVWLQDYIWITPDTLTRYWSAFDMFPNKIVGGLKNHYRGPPAHDLEGELSIWSSMWMGDPVEKCVLYESDDRYKSINSDGDALLIETSPTAYEMCNASLPHNVAIALNGVDERFDEGRGYDNQNISFRAAMLGFATVLDVKNVAREFTHWDYFGRGDKHSPESVDGKPASTSNYQLHLDVVKAVQEGRYPLRAPNDFNLRV